VLNFRVERGVQYITNREYKKEGLPFGVAAPGMNVQVLFSLISCTINKQRKETNLARSFQ